MDTAFRIAFAAALTPLLLACSMQPDVENIAAAQPGAQASNVRDDALAERVRRKLSAGGAPAQFIGVEVTAAGGVVSLHGEVDSAAERRRIALAASTVGGVKGVDNRLRVHPPADTATGS
jgi:osmotically-inducible protein OsmY